MFGLNFNYDAYNQLENPKIFLGYPNKRIIGLLNAKNRQNDFNFNSYSIISFTINKTTNGKPTPFYDEINLGRYVYLENFTWFRITDIEETDTGNNTVLSVTAYTLEYELSNTFITSMGEMGTEDDADGGLDLYCLNDPNDPMHSIRHLIESKNPAWKFKYIDPNITNDKRSYSESSISSYDLLTSTVAKALDCVFMFDGNERTISAYSLENIGKKTGIYLSLKNLVKQVSVKWNEDNICTVFHVTGGDDTTGSPLMINTVNPGGNNYISNFSYYYKDMSPELQNKLEEYSAKVEENQKAYTEAITQLQTYLNELGVLYDKHPTDDENSTDWTQYGLNQLKTKQNSYQDLMSTYTDKIKSDPSVKAEYDKYTNLYNEVGNIIKQREQEIENKNTQISEQRSLISSLSVNLETFLGDVLYKELSLFVREETYNDSTFIATENMTDAEIIDMQQQLMDHAIKELDRVAFPRFEMTVDAINFPNIFKYKMYTDQLDLGNIVYINYGGHHTGNYKGVNENTLQARVLSIHYNWDDRSDFSMTFANSTSLEDGYFELADILSQAQSVSKDLDIKYVGYTNAANKAKEFDEYLNMQEFMDASLKSITNNAENQEVLINSSGLLLRKADASNPSGYAPDKLWLTSANILLYTDNDGTQLKEPKVAIGKVEFEKTPGNWQSYYGVAADVIYGKLLWGQNLILTNDTGSMTFDEKGMIVTGANNFSVKINPNVADETFVISKGDTKLLYVDTAKDKLVFSGRLEASEGYFSGTLEASEGHIAGWTIAADRLYANNGTIGLSSAVNGYNGKSIWVGDNFSVKPDGTITAVNGNFSGDISGSDISGSDITGSTINVGDGFFSANDTEISIGDFTVYYDGRAFFESNKKFGKTCGLSSTPSRDGDTGKLWMWAGYKNKDTYDFVVNDLGEISVQSGKVVIGRINEGNNNNTSQEDIYIDTLYQEYKNSAGGAVWGYVGYNIIELWEEIAALQSDVSELFDLV